MVSKAEKMGADAGRRDHVVGVRGHQLRKRMEEEGWRFEGTGLDVI